MLPKRDPEKDLMHVIHYGTGIGMGSLFALIQALSKDGGSFSIKFSLWSFLFFAGGFGFAWGYWRMIEKGSQFSNRKPLITAMAIMSVIGFAAFASPIRFIPSSALPDTFIGLGLAVLVISGIAFTMVRIAGYLNRDSRENANSSVSPGGENSSANKDNHVAD